MASLAVWSNGCSRHRTQRHGSSLKLVDVTTSLQCSGSFIGCLQSRESTSNWRCWCASLCMASLHWTCQRTVSSLLRWNVGTSGHRTFTRVPCRGQSQIGDRSFTAAGPRLWNSLPIEIRRKDITFEHYRRLLKAYLFVYAAAHCDYFYLSAPDVSTRTQIATRWQRELRRAVDLKLHFIGVRCNHSIICSIDRSIS